VRAALLGGKDPLAELVTRHWETAVALAARVLGSPELARDAAQEATVSAMTGLDRLRSPERFGAWFCGIALNVARRWLCQLRPESVGLPDGDLAPVRPSSRRSRTWPGASAMPSRHCQPASGPRSCCSTCRA
jgi:DNA-directed RNA polymerase specialized sigma24 family protein